MKLLEPLPPQTIADPVERVFHQALDAGAPPCHALVFEDAEGRWRHTVGGMNLPDRRRTVLVAASEAGLGTALRLSLGGATLLPASTESARAALVAAEAAARKPSWCADPGLAAELESDPMAVTVGLRRPRLWRALLGVRGTLEVLAELAHELGRSAVLQPGPSLQLVGVEAVQAGRAWAELAEKPAWAQPGDLCFDAEGSEEGSGEEFAPEESSGWSVGELPSGRCVGRWVLAGVEPRFRPEIGRGHGGAVGAEDSVGRYEDLAEVACREDFADLADRPARVPGWLSLDLDRDGSPGAVLLRLLVEEAGRRSVTLWVSNVTSSRLSFLLRLGATLWVDGPAVPDLRGEDSGGIRRR